MDIHRKIIILITYYAIKQGVPLSLEERASIHTKAHNLMWAEGVVPDHGAIDDQIDDVSHQIAHMEGIADGPEN
jgi:hypothetical protein